MNKISFLKWAVTALILLNVCTVVFFATRKHPPRREGPQKVIGERLHFDAAQIAGYENLIQKHQSSVQAKQQEITAAKSNLYQLLRGTDFSQKDALVGRIGALQQEIEQVHFAHFQEVKALCKGSQVADFDALAGELAQFFARPGGKDNKPPQGW